MNESSFILEVFMQAEGTVKKPILHLILAFIALFVFQQLASKTGHGIAQLFDFSKIDTDNTFAYISVHHIIQMLIAGIAIFAVHRVAQFDFGLRWKFSKAGIKFISIFAGVFLIYVLSSYFIGYYLGSISPYDYPLTAANVYGTLCFQALLSGPSEEILFRALPITIFSYVYTRSENKKLCPSVVCASILFSLAHIRWTLSPFTLTIDWLQLIYAFVLGVAYGVAFKKTGSVIYPMIMHSLSNVLMVGVGYLFMSAYS
jgi:membrane protease YdiL (CAAX protease family)